MSTRKKNSLTQRILFGLATATICIGSAASPVYADTPTVATGDNAVPIQDTTHPNLPGKVDANTAIATSFAPRSAASAGR